MGSSIFPYFCKKCKFVTCRNHATFLLKTSKACVLTLGMRVGVCFSLTTLLAVPVKTSLEGSANILCQSLTPEWLGFPV